nr:class I SAM-dependent methyltransferase [uncultured Tolumonas sp.]
MSKLTSYHSGLRKEMVPFLPIKYSHVLEVGCGTGEFRVHLIQQHEYWGVEPVEAIANIAKEKLDKVLIGTYEQIIDLLPDNYFDLVICNDVIEHMIDYDLFFLTIKSKLKKNGCLVGSIPNVRFIHNLYNVLIKKDWEYKSEGILDKTHMRFFTEVSILRILNRHEFKIQQFQGVNKYSGGNCFFKILTFFTSIILGADIKFLQFGFCVRL